jgi:hypothetical protein
LTWLKSKMATFTEHYGHRLLSDFGARPNSARLAETPATGVEPQANLTEEVYWIGAATTDSALFLYSRRGT